MLGVFLVLVAAVGASGCASAPTVPPPEGIDEMTPPEILYQAIVSTYESRELPIAVSSDKFMVVTSEFQPVSPELRKRLAARVVRAAPGAMGLKVNAEWERRYQVDGQEHWRPIDTGELRERGRSDELELARAIEQRFESWKKQWKEEQDE